jgi:hypothetical protein
MNGPIGGNFIRNIVKSGIPTNSSAALSIGTNM